MPYTEIKEYFGLDTKNSRASLPIGFSPEGHDIDLSIRGVAKTRGGQLKFNAVALGYNDERIFDFYQPSTNTHKFLGNGGTEVFTLSATGVKTTIGTGFTADETFDFIGFKNTVYMSNGVDEPKKWDGTTFSKWGITKPATAITFAAAGAGVLTGDYMYAYTFFNSNTGHESTRSPLSAVFTAAANTVNLTGITVSADAQVTRRRIYRTTSGGAIFFFLTEIADNVTTVYADNTPDSSLGTTEAPEDNEPPSNFVFLEEWDGRIWGVEKNSTKLKFSNSDYLTLPGTGLPEESFSTDNEIDFAVKINGIKKSPYFNELWVHTVKGIRAVRPTSIPDDPYDPIFRNDSWSSISHYSIVNIYNDQWFITEQAKVISMDYTGNVHYESESIEDELTNLNFAKISKIQAAHYRNGTKNQYRFLYTRSGQTNPDRMVAINYLNRTPQKRPTIEIHRIGFSKAIGVVKDSNLQDILYTSDTSQFIQKQDTGTNDNGAAIDWSFSVGWLRSAGSPIPTAFPRWLKMYFVPKGDYNINLRTDFDFGMSGGQVFPVNMLGIGDAFDTTFILDYSVLAGNNPLISNTKDLGGDYQYAEITLFGNALDQVMELHNMMLLFESIEGFRR